MPILGLECGAKSMPKSQPEIPLEYVIRRCQATDRDYLKLLMMPKSPDSMPSWISVNFLTTLYEIKDWIVLSTVIQAFMLVTAGFLFFYMELSGIGVFADKILSIISLMSYVLISVALTTMVIIQGGRGWGKDYPWRYWVIEHEDRFLGLAYFQNYETFSVIRCLRICSKLRRKGLGTALVKKLIQIGEKPIYLSPALGTAKFYRRLGFRRVHFKKLSPKVKKMLISTYCMAHY